jgi:ATP synthase protein I
VVNNKQGLQGAARLFRVQLLVVLMVALIAFMVIGVIAAWSVVLGGLVSALPNAYFARKVFKYHGAQAAHKIVNSFYMGEAVKILLTFALFALIFKTLPIVPLALIFGFIVAQLMFWFAPFIFYNKRK